jgi:hypothetical protein
MQDKQIRRLLLLSRDKQLVGIVSLGDLSVNTGDKQTTGETLQAVSQPRPTGSHSPNPLRTTRPPR